MAMKKATISGTAGSNKSAGKRYNKTTSRVADKSVGKYDSKSVGRSYDNAVNNTFKNTGRKIDNKSNTKAKESKLTPIEWIDLDDEECFEYENAQYDDYRTSEDDYSADYIDEEDNYTTAYTDEEDVYATDYADEEDVYATDYADEEDVYATDYADEEDVYATDYADEEDVYATDYVDEEDAYATDYVDEDRYIDYKDKSSTKISDKRSVKSGNNKKNNNNPKNGKGNKNKSVKDKKSRKQNSGKHNNSDNRKGNKKHSNKGNGYDYYDYPVEDSYYDDDTGIAAIWYKIQDWFYDRTTTDFVMMGGAALVLVLFVVLGGVFFSTWLGEEKATEQLAELGTELEDMNLVIGQSGLLAAADAKEAEIEALIQAEIDAKLAEEAAREAEEAAAQAAAEAAAAAAAKKTVVVLNLTSIQKDLKIKFVNHDTGKLVKGIEFVVKLTDPKGKTSEKTNTDKDGIIYLKNLAGGKYTVALIGPDDEELSFLKDPISITVKDTIEYKKVDVADEIKSEKEINAAQEDTAKNDTVQEGSLTDTVEWVESTKTLIEGTEEGAVEYELVPSEDIRNPGATSKLDMRLLSKKWDEPDGDASPTPTPSEEPSPSTEPSPSEEPSPSTEPSPSEEPSPSTDPLPSAEPSPSEEPSPSADPTPSEEPAPTPSTEPTPSQKPAPSPSVEPTPTPTSTPTPVPTPSVEPTSTPTATPTVTPTVTPTATPTPTKEEELKKDNITVLKDNHSNTLYYMDESGEFKEAHIADYYTKTQFFRKVESATGGKYKYTGWQNIDGYTYYFTKDGEPVTGEQVIQGAKYNFDSEGRLSTGSGVLGIDVSKWNGSIDWNAVKNSGVSFVIIRCGYRGSTVGGLVEDPMFKTYINGATKAGLKVGVYFFSQAINEVEAVEEASTALSLIKGYNVPYGVYLDMETSGGRADGISVDTRTKVAQAFCKTIANAGYKAGVYANKTWFSSLINTPSISNYKIWLAQYAAAPTYTRTRYDIWQYSSKGSVGGIKGNVDMDISYLGY